jgi:predicted aspartyl protease
MRAAGAVRRGLAGAIAVFLAGCLAPGPFRVVVDRGADARLTTTVEPGLFPTRVRIDGVDAGPFLVDTGASDLILDVRLAETLKLRFWNQTDDEENRQRVRHGTMASASCASSSSS